MNTNSNSTAAQPTKQKSGQYAVLISDMANQSWSVRNEMPEMTFLGTLKINVPHLSASNVPKKWKW